MLVTLGQTGKDGAFYPVSGLSSGGHNLGQRLQGLTTIESPHITTHSPSLSPSPRSEPLVQTDLPIPSPPERASSRSGDSNGLVDHGLAALSSFRPRTVPAEQQTLSPSPSPRTSSPRTRSPHTSSSTSRVSPQAVSPNPQVVPRGDAADLIAVATECLHAQDYTKMLETLSLIRVEDETEPELIVAVEFGKGIARYKLKNYSAANKHLTAVVEFGKRQESGKGNVFIASYYLGEVETIRIHYDKAIEHYQQAVTYYDRENVASRFRMVLPSLSSVHAKLASSLRNVSNVMAAVQSYRSAIDTADAKKDELAARTSLGNLYQSLGENTSALKEYERAITLAEQLQDYISLGWAHGNIGNAYLGLYQKDKAIYHLSKSLDLAVEHEPTAQSIGRAYNNLGTAYQSLNDLDKAQEYYELALGQAIYGDDIPGQARVYGNIGNLLMIKAKYSLAIKHYTEALGLTTEKGTKSTAYHNRGCACYEKAEHDRKEMMDRLTSATWQLRGMSDITFLGARFEDVELEHQPMILPDSILKQYTQAQKDLVRVVGDHEKTFKSIKGSAKGLTLSVSLFESNSRTFHRIQDSLYCLGEWKKALEYAEQSRARSLGELLLQKNLRHLHLRFEPPLTIDKILDIVKEQQSDVVFISYTGVRLLAWVFTPVDDTVSLHMFQVTLRDNQFDGKSLDYYLRYSLTDVLVERNLEMYSPCRYDPSSPLTMLYDLIAKPLLRILQTVHGDDVNWGSRDVVLIPDSYSNLLPMVALLHADPATRKLEFLGDKLQFRIMPSLLSMGIMDQLPPVTVRIPEDSRNFCIIGNPTIPTFKYQGERWNLGKLPFATEEAEWVSHILKCSPTLHEQATKPVALSMFMNAKVIHIATHGSAAAGFLAFAGMGSTRGGEPVDERTILIYPSDIERLNISPALVVLSSCDSGRGVVKADGIIGMARAFLLAGAQAVLTTLWRVPDESASVFMQFFFQYLVDGLRSSVALQKAILSVRCFTKYSQFIHWTGYQLTGREFQFTVQTLPEDDIIQRRIGRCALFPRLDVVKKLEKAFIKDHPTPADVQLIQGSHGLKPSEPVMNFISKYHAHFTGGIFWYNGTNPDLVEGATQSVRKVLCGHSSVPDNTESPVLVVFHNIQSLPPPESLAPLQLKNHNVHIIVCSNYSTPADALRREIDQELVRGCIVTAIKPLKSLHTTQRIVHSILRDSHFTPFNNDQEFLARLANETCGSPALIDITTALLDRCKKEVGNGTLLGKLSKRMELSFEEETLSPLPKDPMTGVALTEKAEKEEEEEEGENKEEVNNELTTDRVIEFTSKLIKGFKLDPSEHFLLSLLSTFGPVPIPRAVAEVAQTLILAAKHWTCSPNGNPLASLKTTKLLRPYPAAVIVTPKGTTHIPESLTPSSANDTLDDDYPFVYVPQLVRDALWAQMDNVDKVFCITSAYKTLLQFSKQPNTEDTEVDQHFAAGLTGILVRCCDGNNNIIDERCYREVFRLNVAYRARFMDTTDSGAAVDLMEEAERAL